jgi:hypothetical protein
MDKQLHEMANRIVRIEVYANMSALVEAMAQKGDEDALELSLGQYDPETEEYTREVFEHWSVSSWLASELEKRGETIARDWYGHHIWARTTTGQSISIDGVIEDIVRAMARG